MSDVWFDGQIICSKIEHLSNIDEISINKHINKQKFAAKAHSSRIIGPLNVQYEDSPCIFTLDSFRYVKYEYSWLQNK